MKSAVQSLITRCSRNSVSRFCALSDALMLGLIYLLRVARRDGCADALNLQVKVCVA